MFWMTSEELRNCIFLTQWWVLFLLCFPTVGLCVDGLAYIAESSKIDFAMPHIEISFLVFAK